MKIAYIIIFSVIVLCILAYFFIRLFNGDSDIKLPPSFTPVNIGKVSDVSEESICEFITDMTPNEVRAVLFIDKEIFNKKNKQICSAMELYSLIDQRVFPDMYSNIFESIRGTRATANDVGGVLLVHYNENRMIEIYTIYALKEGQPINVELYKFASKREVDDYVSIFYNKIQENLPFYIVAVVGGPNLIDLDQMLHTNSTLVEEPFNMHESAFSEWLYRYGRPRNENSILEKNDIEPDEKMSQPIDVARFIRKRQ